MTRREILAGAVAAAAMGRLQAAKLAGTDGFKLGIITDELTNQLDQALAFISDYGLHWCELREIWGKNIMNAPQEDLDRAKKIIDEIQGSGERHRLADFKWNLPQMPAKADEKRDEFKASFTGAGRRSGCWKNRSSWRAFSARTKCGSSATGACKIRKKPIRMSATGWRKPRNSRPRTISS